MAISSYDVGDLVQLTASFSVGGVATDPTSVVCTIISPLSVVTTLATTQDSTGNYHAQFDLTGAVAGIWTYRWEGTGAAQAAEEARFYVRESAFA